MLQIFREIKDWECVLQPAFGWLCIWKMAETYFSVLESSNYCRDDLEDEDTEESKNKTDTEHKTDPDSDEDIMVFFLDEKRRQTFVETHCFK